MSTNETTKQTGSNYEEGRKLQEAFFAEYENEIHLTVEDIINLLHGGAIVAGDNGNVSLICIKPFNHTGFNLETFHT